MPAVEPLSPATWVAIGVLLSAVVALWVRPWWVWMAALGLTIVAGYGVGVLDGPAGLAFMLLAFALQRFRSRWGLERAAYATVAILVSLVLALHLGPGFHNPVILRDVVLSPGATRYTQYANFDKGLAGVLILGAVGFARLRSVAGWAAALRQAGPVAAVTIVVVMAASLALGFVRFEPRLTPLFWVWAPINLLLTCVSEEGFFRGFLQREIAFDLQGRRHGAAIAIGVCALLFGIAHLAGGWPYVLLATLAGAGYGLAYQRSGRIEMAILTHFAVNATHFLLFTYPALAGPPSPSTAQQPTTISASVEGQRLHMLVAGQGVPTIVLEAGSGSTARTWRTLQPALATLSRVVAYDRAGLGRSEPSARTRTACAIAEELHGALRDAQLPPPYVLVGHSAGGVYARVFAATYPADVAGLVLVDPAPEGFYARARQEFPDVYARFEAVDAADIASRPAGERAEEDAWDANLAQAAALDSAFTGPAIVLSSPRTDLAELGPLWTDEHRRWARRDPHREYVRVDGAGHAIHQERPDVVRDAVRRIIALSSARP